jgi:hypothetical protein
MDPMTEPSTSRPTESLDHLNQTLARRRSESKSRRLVGTTELGEVLAWLAHVEDQLAACQKWFDVTKAEQHGRTERRDKRIADLEQMLDKQQRRANKAEAALISAASAWTGS